MNKVNNTSVNTGNENLDKLRRVFPQFVKENKIDFDALKKFFQNEEITTGEEKYGLNWAGKSNAFKLIRTPSVGTLTPQEKESKNWDKTENLFIEGDNLEVLKLLQKHYREKIKMIYIDPPYNTGKDFIYKDNYTENISDYYEKTGQSKNGIKMTTNPESAGRYHSDWLTMMYPRLFLARNLLKEDGVIFISIDDNEVANLRLIMDEIFGEENIDCFIWKKSGDDRYGKMKNTETFRKDHEYIFIGFKNILKLNKIIEKPNFKNEYDNPDNDPRGTYKAGSISKREDASDPEDENYYSVTSPSGKVFTRQFDIPKEEFEELNQENRIYWGKNNDAVPAIKIYINEKREITPYSVLSNQGSTYSGKIELRKIFEISDKQDIFSNPKPSSLVQTLVQLSTSVNNGDIVLDFFAGSGTTTHAVMKQNLEDSGNRISILVQLPEALDSSKKEDKYAFNFLKSLNKPTNIAEICKERIRRTANFIAKSKTTKQSFDLGFKSLSLTKSNYRQWNILTDKDNEQKLKKQMKLFLEKPLIDGYDEKSVVYEILLKEGYDFNSKVTQEKSGNMKYWQVVDEGKKLLVTFEKKVTKDQVESLKLSEEDTFVCLDSALDDTTKINIGRNLNVKVI